MTDTDPPRTRESYHRTHLAPLIAWRRVVEGPPMTTPLVNASKQEGVMVLELNAPPANTYSYEMMRELDAHVLDARMDEAVHVIMITGAGEKFFCAGADIKMLEKAEPYFKYNFCLHANETLCR